MTVHLKKTLSSLLLVSMAIASTSCALFGGKPPQMGGAVPVELMEIKATSVAITSNYLVKLEARENVTLQPETAGRVVAIMTAPGQFVSQGQPLIQLDAGVEYAALESSQSSAQAAVAQAKQAEDILKASRALRESSISNIAFNEQQLARTKALLAKDAASPQELEKATDAMNKARNDLAINNAQIASQQKALDAAKANIASAKANVQRAQAVGGKLTIRAPFSGIVGNIPVRMGQSVSPMDSLLQLTDARRLEINLSVAVNDARRLHLGQKIRLQNNAGQTVGEAAVFFVASDVDPATQTTLVKAFINNSDGFFKAEEQLQAAIVWEEVKGIVIPPSALTHLAGLDFVFVAEAAEEKKDDTTTTKAPGQKTDTKNETKPAGLVAKQRPVVLGDMLESGYRVIKGLKPGDIIVVAGVQKLQDNTPIQQLQAPPKDGKAPDAPAGKSTH